MRARAKQANADLNVPFRFRRAHKAAAAKLGTSQVVACFPARKDVTMPPMPEPGW